MNTRLYLSLTLEQLHGDNPHGLQSKMGHVTAADGSCPGGALLLIPPSPGLHGIQTQQCDFSLAVPLPFLFLSFSSVSHENGVGLQLVPQRGVNGTKLICTVKCTVMKAWPHVI